MNYVRCLFMAGLALGGISLEAQQAQQSVPPESSPSSQRQEGAAGEVVFTEEEFNRVLERIERSFEKSAKSFEDHLKIFEITIAVVVSCATLLIGLVAALMAFYQMKNERRHKEEWMDWKSSVEKDLRIWEGQIERDFERRCEEVSRKASDDKLEQFELRFKEEIFREVRMSMQEVVMQTPAARGLLVARFRRLSQDLSSALPESGDWASSIQEILSRGIQDWHVLGQLFSSDREQLRLGLQALKLFPIREIGEHLKVLRAKYANDPEVLSLIRGASESMDLLSVGR